MRAYGDVSPGAPRFAGAVLAACRRPDVPWRRIVRADGSLAKGARQRALLEAEGVPFRGERVDMRVGAASRERRAMWLQREITLDARARAASTSITREVVRALPELARARASGCCTCSSATPRRR